MPVRDAPALAADPGDELERLRARVAMLEAVIEAIPDPVFVKGEDRRFLLVNQHCAQFVGQDIDTMIGASDADFFPPDQVEWFYARDSEVLRTGEQDEQAETITDATGQVHVISTRKGRGALPDGRLLLVGTIRKLSAVVADAVRRESELRSTLGVLERLTALMPVGVLHVDREGKLVYAFGPDLRAMGMTPDRVAGAHFRDLRLIWPELEPMFEDALQGRTRAAVLEWRGRTRHVTVAPVLDARQRSIGATLISMDLTEQRLAEQREVRAERMDSLGRLAGGVAHDLNNLLSIVMMGTSVLRDALAAGELGEAMGQVRLLERSIDRGSRLSRQLASFARRQVGPPTVVDLHAHLRPVQVFLDSLVGADIQVQVQLGAESPRVRILPGQVEQLLVNLVLHAASAMVEGGTVLVETTCVDLEADPELPAGRYVAIRVRDQAPPLSRAARERLFEPFYDPDGRGGSMGLATCYGIAVQAGGRVRALGGGGGNVTEVLLPRTEAEPGGPVEEPRVRVSSRPGLRILVAEDEDVLREQICQLLRTAGHLVPFAARDGQVAREWLADHADEVDVVLSDIVMPHLSGVDLALSLDGRLPVVLMSGFVADHLLRLPDMASRFPVLMKPVRPDELLAALALAADEDRQAR
ncbi:PAS domain-containing protein [Myxococcota bacterium]|nr:PAS domain-containing protein [Myxococcota bacterium]